MPKGSEALTRARREEIIDACAALYKTMSLREITIKLIGARTSFTRTSIYNYFETKEEIFLALLQREYAAWTDDLNALPAQPGADGDAFDFIFGMDEENLRDMRRILGACPARVALLLGETLHPRAIADPWYTGNFDETFSDIAEGCRAFLASLEQKGIV